MVDGIEQSARVLLGEGDDIALLGFRALDAAQRVFGRQALGDSPGPQCAQAGMVVEESLIGDVLRGGKALQGGAVELVDQRVRVQEVLQLAKRVVVISQGVRCFAMVPASINLLLD